MQWAEIIIYILLSVLSGIIFSASIFIVLYQAYRVEVKHNSFNLHLRILKQFKNWMEIKSHKNQLNSYLNKYHTLVAKPSFLGIIIPLSIVIIIGFLLYYQMIFFAVVGSGSMEPTFKKNDLILMQKINVEVNNEDIIMFKTPTVLIPVTHRVVGVSDDMIFTKGDAGRFRDDWVVKNDQILGKAITYNKKPIIIKDVGIYLIEDVEWAIRMSRYGHEFDIVKKLITSIKSFGLVIFVCAIFIYILTSIKS